MTRFLIFASVVLCLSVVTRGSDRSPVKPSETDEVFFEGAVRQVFKTHCLHCHGEAGVVEADLDLRLVRLMIEAGVVEAGDADASYLLDRMSDGSMPPEDVAIRPTQAEIDLVRRWIAGGAKTARAEPEDADDLPPISPEERAYWAFQPIRRPPVPVVSVEIDHPIDAFIQQRLSTVDRSLSPIADPRTLLRRVTFDLTGLPPTPRRNGRVFGEPFGCRV